MGAAAAVAAACEQLRWPQAVGGGAVQQTARGKGEGKGGGGSTLGLPSKGAEQRNMAALELHSSAMVDERARGSEGREEE